MILYNQEPTLSLEALSNSRISIELAKPGRREKKREEKNEKRKGRRERKRGREREKRKEKSEKRAHTYTCRWYTRRHV